LAGEINPLSARIVAFADVFDAQVRDRPYKSMTIDKAINIIKNESGCHFPLLVTYFLDCIPAF